MRKGEMFVRAGDGRPRLEELESRLLPSGFQPTGIEQWFLELLNDARADPAVYGAKIGVDLSSVPPSPPLAFDLRLIQAARQQAQDMNARSYFSHTSPEGARTGDRLTAVGYPWTSWGESLAGGTAYPTPAEALSALIADVGVPELTHRRHLLAIDDVFRSQTQVGIGALLEGLGPLHDYYAIDTAAPVDARPIVTGVVYVDRNLNGAYDPDEGLPGVSVSIPGLASTTTFDSGGYSLPVGMGVYQLTVSGGALSAPMTRSAIVGTINMRLDFVSSPPEPALIEGLYRSVLGREATESDLAYWTGVQASQGSASVIAGIEQSQEARGRTVARWYVTYLGRSAGSDEIQYWISSMVLGATETQIQAVILGSAEYAARIGDGPASQEGGDSLFVASLYRQLLNREASKGEIDYFVTNYLPTSGREGVARVFFDSSEYRQKLVVGYYEALLRRSAGSEEIAYWVDSTLDPLHLRLAMEASAEFRQMRWDR